MKKISIMVPCYNEEENVIPMSEALVAELEKLPQYDYEILFIDNCSLDTTREKLREICAGNKKIKAIFNSKNFGQFNSPYYGLCQTTGDCTISVCCDFHNMFTPYISLNFIGNQSIVKYRKQSIE